MKKITADFHKKMESKIPKTKTINVEVEGEDYEILIKNFLSLEERVKFITDGLSLMEANIELDEKTGSTLLLMIIYKNVTNIEFPEDLKEQVSQFTWLLETGVLKKVSENIKPGFIEELADFLTRSFLEAEKEAKRILDEKLAEKAD